MTWVYMRTEPQLWTVGFYTPDGVWKTDSDHDVRDEAAKRVHYLNGGARGMNELKISGAQLETLEHYVDRQREIGAQIFFCAQAMDKARRYNEIAIGGDPVPISDETRSTLLEFLTATKLELERQARGMGLEVRIGEEESDEEEKDDEWAQWLFCDEETLRFIDAVLPGETTKTMIEIPEGMSVEVTIYYRIDGMNGSSSYGRIRGEHFTGGSLLEIRDRYLGKLCKMIGHPVSLCSKEEHDANVYEKEKS